MTIGIVFSAFMVGMIAGAWSILSLLSLNPQVAEAWRRRK
jgi:hypothetical protein